MSHYIEECYDVISIHSKGRSKFVAPWSIYLADRDGPQLLHKHTICQSLLAFPSSIRERAKKPTFFPIMGNIFWPKHLPNLLSCQHKKGLKAQIETENWHALFMLNLLTLHMWHTFIFAWRNSHGSDFHAHLKMVQFWAEQFLLYHAERTPPKNADFARQVALPSFACLHSSTSIFYSHSEMGFI